ncbi:Hypothetical protein FKW44_000885 [Caligus rogercresseyi]|uniref:Uncharacterized protein n=1 Tax=Caligus rogercresseyi TaxID=217165 RepID=A0A7T8KI71_CALRO|nr:Hypothetical protein FKW44_000885 [Caligus rogercresseyi]
MVMVHISSTKAFREATSGNGCNRATLERIRMGRERLQHCLWLEEDVPLQRGVV